MPIQFRCTNCNQKLAISRRKAGKVVTCPACAADLQVPSIEQAQATGQLVETPPHAPPPAAEPPPEPPELTPSEQLFDEVPPEVYDDLDDLEDLEDADTSEPVAPPVIEPVAPPESSFEPPTPEPSHELEPPLAEPAPAEHSAATATRHPWTEDDEEEEDGFHLARRPPDEGGLDMTPMVDVTFLLLIFFMITASFSIQKSMEAEAPEPDEEGAAQMPSMDDLANDSVIVEIDENDVIYVDDTQVASIGELTSELELKIANEQKREMIIEPHPLAKHGTVVQATDAGIEVGMQRIRRVTRKSE